MTDLEKFKPNLSPVAMLHMGVFGGSYFSDRDLIDFEEFPSEWFEGLDPKYYLQDRPRHRQINSYGVKAGMSQEYWDNRGWMHPDDPRGWFQWYCRYYLGRRHEDDERQMKRWIAMASPQSGRQTRQLFGKIYKSDEEFTNSTVSPVLRQSLLHWAYSPTEADYKSWLKEKGLA